MTTLSLALFYSLLLQLVTSFDLVPEKVTKIELRNLQVSNRDSDVEDNAWSLTVHTAGLYNRTYLNSLTDDPNVEKIDQIVAISYGGVGCSTVQNRCASLCTAKLHGNQGTYTIQPYFAGLGCPTVEAMLRTSKELIELNARTNPWQDDTFRQEFRDEQSRLPRHGCSLVSFPGQYSDIETDNGNHLSNRFDRCFRTQFFETEKLFEVIITVNTSISVQFINKTRAEWFDVQYFPATQVRPDLYGGIPGGIRWAPEQILDIRTHSRDSEHVSCVNEAVFLNHLGYGAYVNVVVYKFAPSPASADAMPDNRALSVDRFYDVLIHGYEDWRYLKVSTYYDFKVCWYLQGLRGREFNWYEPIFNKTTHYCKRIYARDRKDGCPAYDGVHLSSLSKAPGVYGSISALLLGVFLHL